MAEDGNKPNVGDDGPQDAKDKISEVIYFWQAS